MPKSAARCRKENAAAERRKARPARVMGWVISGDPEMGVTARRATGAAYPHQRLSALCSPSFLRERRRDEGHPAPHANRLAELWLVGNESECLRGRGVRAANSVTLPWRGRVGEQRSCETGWGAPSHKVFTPPRRS